MSAPSFKGHVAFVTGAASGIGFGIATAFATEGAHVALVDIDIAEGERALAKLRDLGERCRFFQCDVSSEDEVRETVHKVAVEFGAIDHLVNNAGIVLVKCIEETTEAEWDRVMGVNVKSIFLSVKHLLPALRRSRSGTIVNIGSVSSFVGQKQTPAYVASKGAVSMLSKALALDLSADGIRVNCVCPGITDTPMLHQHMKEEGDHDDALRARLHRVPLGRILTPDDIAAAVLFLSGTTSAGITGTDLLVDAGYLAAAEWSN